MGKFREEYEARMKNPLITNKIIAEFMGLEFKDGVYVNNHESPSYLGYSRSVEQLEYNSSWDWLMPVIEKISNDVYEEGFEDGQHVLDTAYPRTFGMLNPETRKPMFRFNKYPLFEADTLIEAAYKAVISYIKMKDLMNCKMMFPCNG